MFLFLNQLYRCVRNLNYDRIGNQMLQRYAAFFFDSIEMKYKIPVQECANLNIISFIVYFTSKKIDIVSFRPNMKLDMTELNHFSCPNCHFLTNLKLVSRAPW